MSSKAATVPQFISELPAERRAAISTVRDVVRHNLPAGYSEFMGYGMICWGIPLERYPDSYNGQPLCYAGLASQKNHCSLYLMNVYHDDAHSRVLRDGFAAMGKKLDMGKSCIRFRSADDLALSAIAEVIASTTPEQFIARTEALRAMSRPAKKAAPVRSRKTGATARSAKRPAAKRPARTTGSRRTAAKRRAR